MSFNPFKRKARAEEPKPDQTGEHEEPAMSTTTNPSTNTSPAATPAAKAEPEAAAPKQGAEAQAATAAASTPAVPATPAPATVQQLRQAFGDDPFVFQAIDKGWTMEQAAIERAKALSAENDRLKAGAARIGDAGKAGTDPVGTAPRTEAPGGGSGAGEEHPYLQEVKRVAAADKVPTYEAINRVNKARPDLRMAYTGRR